MTIAKRMLVRRKAWFMRRELMRRRPMTPLTKMGMNMIRRVEDPRSSDDEEHDSETLAQFNEKAEFGHVYLELGMEFVFNNNMAFGDWVAKKLEKQILTQPNMTKTEAYEHMKVKYNTHLNMKKVINALEKAKKSREGSEKEQFGNIRLYLSELLRSNPDPLAGYKSYLKQSHKLHRCSTECTFVLMLQKGVQGQCEPFIGLDGCFLKGYYGGGY
ncbi:hypothetical protein K1719_023260 [Acacia pycnantha]|nr:hypothetical protein K1719_023260 [Acacia pycnantha]